jgi:hypothetical protein
MLCGIMMFISGIRNNENRNNSIQFNSIQFDLIWFG